MNKQLLSLYKDFEIEELERLSEYPEDIETECPLCCDDCMNEHLKAINYLIKLKNNGEAATQKEKTKIRRI